MASVENFLLHRPDHYLEFQKHVQNIIDWGKNERLQSIQEALDTLVEREKKALSIQKLLDTLVEKRKKKTSRSRPSPLDISRDHKKPRILSPGSQSSHSLGLSPKLVLSQLSQLLGGRNMD